jgi:hypothetical protein
VGDRRLSLTPPITLLKRGGESTGQPIDEGEMKGVQRHFNTASHVHGRMANSGERHGGTGRGGGGSSNPGGRWPQVGLLGPKAKTSWASMKIF